MHKRFTLPLLLLLAVLIAGCRQPKAAPPAEAAGFVVTTLYPLTYMTQAVAGDRLEVATLLPAGSDPHNWEPTPSALRHLQEADLVIYNGEGFEPWLGKALASVGAGQPTLVAATQGLPPEADPHVWLDPVLAQEQLRLITAALRAFDPAGERVYTENSAALAAKLEALAGRYERLAHCPQRTVIVPHGFLTYVTSRYGLNQVPLVAAGHEGEPTPGAVARIVDLIRTEGITHLFAEADAENRLLDAIARETGTTILPLYSLETVPPSAAAAGLDYLDLLARNLENLVTGLACGQS